MTFTRCIASGVAGLILAGSAGAQETGAYLFNKEAMARHDAAMYQLVDDLADCAAYYSMLMNRSESTPSKVLSADTQRAIFLTLGADALTTLAPGPRNTQLLEMETRIISSQGSLQNTFGSLGGAADKNLKAMAQICERLRKSKRRVFGWTKISNTE